MRVLIFSLLLSVSWVVQAQQNTYNKAKADSLGADEYGMKMYTMVILKTGAKVINDSKVKDSLFRGHMENINRLASEGKLIVAGPFEKNGLNYRGVFIFNVSSMDEAQTLVKTDPTVIAGIFDYEILEWYGPAALSEYLRVQNTIEQKLH
jgi:uncharacterized protein YciI